jgi:hypothetical protein
MENGENQMPFDHHAPIRFQRICEIYRVLKETLETKIFLEGFSAKKDSVQRLCILEESYPNIERICNRIYFHACTTNSGWKQEGI